MNIAQVGKLRLEVLRLEDGIWVPATTATCHEVLCLLEAARVVDTPETLDEADNDRDRWLQECSRECMCCPVCWGNPCPGCCAGGVCDRVRCSCHDEEDDDDGNDESE